METYGPYRAISHDNIDGSRDNPGMAPYRYDSPIREPISGGMVPDSELKATFLETVMKQR